MEVLNMSKCSWYMLCLGTCTVVQTSQFFMKSCVDAETTIPQYFEKIIKFISPATFICDEEKKKMIEMTSLRKIDLLL